MDVREIHPSQWPEILAAWPEDPSALASLYDEGSRKRTVLIAWDGAAPQGYGVVQWEGPVAPNARAAFPHAIELNHLWVFDSARGKGAGTALIRAAEQAAAARGHTRVLVGVGEDNPDGPDHDFFRTLAVETDARTITDLGCGTGILTVTLAGPGRRVVGIDPAPVMLKRAASRPGGDAVEWVLGTSERIETGANDLIIMSGNVAMHIIGDDWTQTLRDVARGLKPSGRLAFEARNPLAEAWRTWNDAPTERDTPVGPLRESATTDPPGADGVVTMHCHNEFIDDGSAIDVDVRLQFRTLEQVVTDLSAAGLEVINVWRDWARTPFTNTEAEPFMVFEARISTAGRDRLLTGINGDRP